MSKQTIAATSAARNGATRSAIVITILIVVLLALGGYWAFNQTNRTFSAFELHGGPIITTATPDGEIIALTSHRESRRFVSSSDNVVTITNTLHWDLWSFSTADLSRKWITRLASIRNGELRLDGAILGAYNGVIWLLADQLLAVSMKDGHVLADNAAIEAKNTFLRGAMPETRQQLLFDRGLIVIAADGRRWRINESTFAATLYTVGGTDDAAQTGVALTPARLSRNTESFKTRGYVVDRQWYGLIHPSEAQALEREMIEQDFRESLRYTFWTAAVRDTVDRFGTPFRAPKDFQPVAGSPEFLLGGLLASRDSVNRARVLGIANPTRFIVLHQDRIDRQATQLLTCLTMEGRVCWDANLGVSAINNVERLAAGTAENWALLFVGERPMVKGKDATRAIDANHNTDVVLVRVKATDGSAKRMSFGDIDLAKVADETKAYNVPLAFAR